MVTYWQAIMNTLGYFSLFWFGYDDYLATVFNLPWLGEVHFFLWLIIVIAFDILSKVGRPREE